MTEAIRYGTEVNVFEMHRATLHELNGVVDHDSVPRLFKLAHEGLGENRTHIVFDLSRVNRITAAGLKELVDIRIKARNLNGDVYLAAPSQQAQEALEASGLVIPFAIYPTQVEAIGAF